MQIIRFVNKSEYISDALLSDENGEFWYSDLLMSNPRRKEADALLQYYARAEKCYREMWEGNGTHSTEFVIAGIARAIREAVEELRPTQRALDLPSAPVGCKCFVSIESYNNCPVHGTANQ
jgi:hypothetical protein